MKLAAVVITHNEERNIARCLKSLKFCQEIIVVDSQSTDRTVEIAKRFTDKIFKRPWRGYITQKNEATELADADWVINVDADEEVSDDLKEEIIKLLESCPQATAFSIPRKTIHSGTWIRFGGWYPNRVIRLYRKSKGYWVGSELHERWETEGKELFLNEHIIHHSFDSIADQVERNNRYSTLGARQLQQTGKRFFGYRLFTKPITKFLECYLLKKGFLDGYPGIMIAISAGYSVFLKWAKLWELEKGARSG